MRCRGGGSSRLPRPPKMSGNSGKQAKIWARLTQFDLGYDSYIYKWKILEMGE